MDEKSHLAGQMPQTIGRYQVLGGIGYGAMGAVYKAFDPLIKRTLAIKTIRLDIPRQSPQYKSFIERFYHEARISGTLSHPHIVTLFDIGEEAGSPYLAMEYVEGETIASLLERGVRFPPEKVIGLVSQIASAIDYAHSKGVIHRDIKPSNLILFDSDRVKVTDFGIAKLVDAEMTQSGTLLGTPSYMSPEQAMGDKLDGRSDIFSLGVCAFEMLSGEQPFPGNNVTSILYKLVHVDPIEPANLEMHGLVPQKWHDVFSKVLAKRPDDRYQTSTAFVQDLEYCMGSWFGAAMGDETLSGGGQTLVMAAGDAADRGRSLPRLETAAPAKPAPAPADAELPPTVFMKAPAPPAADDQTLLIGRPAQAPPPPGEQTVRAPVAPAPPARDRADAGPQTVRMKAAATSSRPAPGDDVRGTRGTLKPPSKASPKATIPPAPAAPVSPRATIPPAPKAPAPPPGASPRATIPPAPPSPAGTTPATPVPAAPTATLPIAPRRRKTAPLALVGVGLLLVAAAVVGGVLVLKDRFTAAEPSPVPATTLPQRRAAAPPSTTLPPPPGGLRIESDPQGATVVVDGQERGLTPLEMAELPLGDHEVRLELKGYEPRAQTVTLSEQAPRSDLSVPLTRLAPAAAVVDFLSTPFGATVKVDGAVVGQTPLTDYRLKPGSHRIEIAKDGYTPHVEAVRLDGGRRRRVDAPLAAVRPSPTPPPETVDANRIYNTSEVDTPPKKLSGSSATYPDNAPRLKSGESVSCSVSYVVGAGGEVVDVKVDQSAGKVVDDAVTAAVRTWKYAPGVKRGTKVKVRMAFRQTFKTG